MEKLNELFTLLSGTALEKDEDELYNKVLTTFQNLNDLLFEFDEIKKEFVEKGLLEEDEIDCYLE